METWLKKQIFYVIKYTIFLPYLNYLMKRSHIYQTKIIYYIFVKEFCLYPISKIEVDSTE